MEVTLYYFTCEGEVITASTNYDAVLTQRNGIAQRAAEGEPGLCTEPHAIHHKVVWL